MSLVAIGASSAAADEGGSLVAFHSMTPITGAAVGAVNDRGIAGGGLPWRITLANGEVNENGLVQVNVRGLVLAAGGNTGRNPLPTFAATVSCITPSGIANVTTANFPASMSGDSTIHDRVSLPSDCMHPEVFVGSVIGGRFRWFAVSNAQQEDGD